MPSGHIQTPKRVKSKQSE